MLMKSYPLGMLHHRRLSTCGVGVILQDYNTCTLPHTKYYDLEAYEKKKAARAAKKGVDPKVCACDIMMMCPDCGDVNAARYK
jgi:hypothetical protein